MTTLDIYIGVIRFVRIQFAMLIMLRFAPALATWLPHALMASEGASPATAKQDAVDQSRTEITRGR